MRNLIATLLASTALLAQPGWAEEVAAEAAAAADVANEGEIIVLGKGETKQVQEVSARDIAVMLPGTSPLKAIEKLPSVNIQSADAFGNYEWSTRVTIRSFNQNQLGFNFDGIPLGDMSYGNHNGLHISRVISPENIGSVRVTQGSGSLGTQSTNNLGGTVETFSMDPLDRLAGQANATYGSDGTMRGFVRLNAGSANGLRGFVSYGYGSTDKYRGEGKQDQHMVNAKVVMPLGEATLDAWFSFSDRREQDYQDMSLGMLSRLGYGWDNSFPDYAAAIRYADIGNNRGETGAPVSNAAAGTVYPGNVTSVDDAYYDASGLRQDTVAAIGFKSPLGEGVTELDRRGYEVELITPQNFATLPLPGYASIRLAMAPRFTTRRMLGRFKPDIVHIATEGPIGWSARSWCKSHKVPFTSAFHTQFPKYAAVRTGLSEDVFWPVMRRFHRSSRAVLAATASLAQELRERGIDNVRPWGRGVDHWLFRPTGELHAAIANLPRPILLNVGRVPPASSSRASSRRLRASAKLTSG